MTDKLLDATTHGPEARQTEPYRNDWNPGAGEGSDSGLSGRQPEESARTAYDVEEAHRQLVDWNDDDLRQVPLLPAGARLEQGAMYVDLRDPARRAFAATGEMQVPSDGLYVPRTEVDDRTWNRLLGVRIPERAGSTG
jgi:hypothetical protein